MTNFEKWREKQIYEKGDIQHKAEAQLARQEASGWTSVVDANGVERPMKKIVADKLLLKKEVSVPKKVFLVPDLSHIDWSN
jgi:hypothetical protein